MLYGSRNSVKQRHLSRMMYWLFTRQKLRKENKKILFVYSFFCKAISLDAISLKKSFRMCFNFFCIII